MIKVLFLCTANSCRSQMAEGLARELGKGFLEPYSAGIMPFDYVQPRAVEVMKEIGIDISKQKPKMLDTELFNSVDVVITLCDEANDLCPQVPKTVKRYHWSIKDPVRAIGTEEMILNEYRRARDEIKKRILKLIADYKNGDASSS
ncbi:MAG: arsenate reductase ArsC [Thermodesulfovibrionales bacterium]|nr:arsenate reductase ArsC [Thermodesulfovibrionales bacterium]